MSGKFIATIVAAAVVITSLGAAPARADNKDLKRALGALLGVAIVGKIIHDNKKDDHVVSRNRTDRHVETYRDGRARSHVQPRHRRVQPHVQPRPLPRRVDRRRLLPAKCFRTFQSRRGEYQGFGQHCLNNNFRHVNSLPQHCRIRVRGNHGPRIAYEARCLRGSGYRLARG